MNILVIDVGGNNVKALASGETESRKFPSGPKLTPEQMVSRVQELAEGWDYEVVSIGYPGVVQENRVIAEPHNLGKGWVGFNFEKAFKLPVKLVNDAALQAFGSYQEGKLLFLGLGTGLGSALVVNGQLVPLELAHLPYKNKSTFEDYVGIHGMEKHGKKKWRRAVADVVERLDAAILPDEIVLGGGNVKKLEKLPAKCRLGDNANAFVGGFRLWEDAKTWPAETDDY